MLDCYTGTSYRSFHIADPKLLGMYKLVKLHNYTAGAVKFCYVKYFVLFSGIVYLTGFSCFVLFLRKMQSLQELIFFTGKVVTSLWLPELCALGICKKNILPNELHSVVSRSTNVFDVCRTSVRDGASYCLVVYRKSWKEKLPEVIRKQKRKTYWHRVHNACGHFHPALRKTV